MKRLLLLFALTFTACAVVAQTNTPIPLWPDGAPGALGAADKDIPTLTPFLPGSNNAPSAAMIICPGGGYVSLAEHEGRHYALWLNERGIAGFVLKYRLGSGGYHHPSMLQDAARAVRLVRANAAEWKIDTKRVGVMGSSAGGHLASTLLTHFDNGKPDSGDPIERQSSRPDLGVLCYAVITMGTNTHQGSKNSLLGRDPSPDLVTQLSNELQVTPQTPPCFIWHTWEDRTVKVENSIDFAYALRRVGVPFEIHVYQKGAHGLGLGTRDFDANKRLDWTRDCMSWLKVQGFAN